MTKTKAPEDKKKPGKKGWIHGTKFTFFDSRKGDWQAAVQASKQTSFYTKVTKLYFLKYGDLPLMEDLAEDTEDPEDDALELADLTEEEATEKQEAFKSRRTVRASLIALFPLWLMVVLQAISQWYRAQYTAINKSADTPFARILSGINNSTTPRPRRPRIIQFYSTMYYKTRIKRDYEIEWARIRSLPVPDGQKKPVSINIRNRVTREKWEQEDPELRKLVEQKAQEDYDKAVAAYEAAEKAPASLTAQDYHK